MLTDILHWSLLVRVTWPGALGWIGWWNFKQYLFCGTDLICHLYLLPFLRLHFSSVDLLNMFPMVAFFQSSLAAARADNFYYPPEWTPNQVCQSVFVMLLKFAKVLHLCLFALLKWISLWILMLHSQGSLNKFHGQHALRERARKIDQGILIIRWQI